MKLYKTRVDFEGAETTHDLYTKIDDIVGGYAPKGYIFVEPDEIYIISTNTTRLKHDAKYKSEEYTDKGFIGDIWFSNVIIDQYMEYFGSDSAVEDTRLSPYVIFQREEDICRRIEANNFMEHEIKAFEGENVEVTFEGGLYIFALDDVQYDVTVSKSADWYKVVIIDRTVAREAEEPIMTEEEIFTMSKRELDESDASDLDGVVELLEESDSVILPIKATRTTIDVTDLVYFASMHCILEWSEVSTDRLNVTYIDGSTSKRKMDEIKETLANTHTVFSLWDWQKQHKDNVTLISEVLDIWDTDYVAEFVHRVDEFNEKSTRYHAELRADLMDIEDEHRMAYEDDVHLHLDWEYLVATASKKERITRIASNKISPVPRENYHCYVEIEMPGGNGDCWIHEELITEEILCTYPVNEHVRQYLAIEIDYPFTTVRVNNQVMIIEVIQ